MFVEPPWAKLYGSTVVVSGGGRVTGSRSLFSAARGMVWRKRSGKGAWNLLWHRRLGTQESWPWCIPLLYAVLLLGHREVLADAK